MKLLNRIILMLFVFSVLWGQTIHAQNDFAEIITNSTVRSEDMIAIAVRIKNDDQTINTSINGNFQLLSSSAILDDDIIKIQHGVGSISTKVQATEDFILSIEGFYGSKAISVNNNMPVLQIGGEIGTNTQWTSDNIYLVLNNLTINNDATLSIEEGTRVVLVENVNLFIEGKLLINGTNENPVFFKASNINNPWGGIRFLNGNESATINHCFFIYGGGDHSFEFGHSDSQAVLMVENATLTLNNCFIIDNAGKAIGGNRSQIEMDNCLISRCDTGGEYHLCLVNFSDSYFIDIPNDNGIPIDDDNDGSYFYNVHPDHHQASTIENCVFITGKDDGVDHNGAWLEIKNCWIQGFDHEGIAASNMNYLSVFNTLVKDCEQGIEAGYGEPEVSINHCVLVNNDVGLRFGDSYDWGSEGHINTINTIIYNNNDNILNYDLLTQGPVEGAIDISYTMTNDTEYNNYPNCITGTPQFDENYFLLSGSPGYGMASDGSDMGLTEAGLFISEDKISPIKNFEIYPNPFRFENNISFIMNERSDVLFRVFNFKGELIFKENFQDLPVRENHIYFRKRMVPGLYYFTFLINNTDLISKKVIAY